MNVKIHSSVIEELRTYPKSVQESLFNHFSALIDPENIEGDIGPFIGNGTVQRWYIDKKFFVLIKLDKKDDEVRVIALMTIAQAVDTYGRYY